MRRVRCLSHASLVFVLMTGWGWLGAACSEEPAKPEEEKKKQATNPVVEVEPGEPLVIPAFLFGPYTIEDVPGTDAVFAEVGFFDRREVKGTGDADIFDRRDRHAAMASLPTSAAQKAGCSEVAAVSATAGTLNPQFTGDFTEKLTAAADGVWRFEDDNESSSFPVDGEQTLEFSPAGKMGFMDVTMPKGPSYAGLQLAGAFDANLTINTNIGDINDALSDSSDELLFGDAGTGVDYDVAVIILHGGSKAETAQIRCVFAAAGSATLSPELYKKVLPIRRISGLVAKLGDVDGGEPAAWRARFSGQSVEDLRVP